MQAINIHHKIRRALIKTKNLHKDIEYVGCNVQQLRNYFESKFQLGMTWDNYSYHGWSIDYIKPFAKFDFL